MLSIELVDWDITHHMNPRSVLDGKSIIFCVLVRDNSGWADWVVWRSHSEFLALQMSLEQHTSSETGSDVTEISTPGNSQMDEAPEDLQFVLEKWLKSILRIHWENGKDILQSFLTADAKATTDIVTSSKEKLSLSSVNVCRFNSQYTDTECHFLTDFEYCDHDFFDMGESKKNKVSFSFDVSDENFRSEI